ncbi:MAG: serine/threonine protein kinase [bacterium]
MGKALGRYKIVEQMSTGSASKIYLAEQKNLDRKVVIKELMREYSLNQRIIARFEQEARIISSLRYDSIIHIYDFWKKGDSYYIVMEYVPGKTLKEVLSHIGSFPVDISLIIFYEIVKALEYAHNQGIIHRDLKPANIIVSEEGRLKLLDFGIAHVKETTLTTPGVILGTYSYMSPEQAIGTKIDHRSDIFSLGIIMYELLTGERPFKREGDREVTEQIIRAKPVSPKKLNPSIPRPLVKIIKKCLKKKPKKRFQHMGQIKERFERYIRKFPLDHQSVLREFLKDSVLFKDQKTVFTESQEGENHEKKRPKLKTRSFFKKKKNPLFRVTIMAGLLVGILVGLEFLLIKYLGINLNTQKEWLLPIWEKLSYYVGKFWIRK